MAEKPDRIIVVKKYNHYLRPPFPEPEEPMPDVTEQAHMRTKQLVSRFKEAGMLYEEWKKENKW